MEGIRLKSKDDIKLLKKSGLILSEVLKRMQEMADVGVSLESMDKEAASIIKNSGAKAAFYNFQPAGASKPFPGHICTSVNDQLVHGVPTGYKLKNGDVLKVDCGVSFKGMITDAAFTVVVGSASKEAENLITTTKEALKAGLKKCKAGNHLGDIGWAIQKTIEDAGMFVVKNLTGHGVGFDVHEPPTVFNVGNPGTGIKLKEGLVLAIEPMVSVSSENIIIREDDSFATDDGSLSAQFETTVAIEKNGPLVLVQLPG